MRQAIPRVDVRPASGGLRTASSQFPPMPGPPEAPSACESFGPPSQEARRCAMQTESRHRLWFYSPGRTDADVNLDVLLRGLEWNKMAEAPESPTVKHPSPSISSDPAGAAALFEQSVAIMARLRAPEGCPWDRE